MLLHYLMGSCWDVIAKLSCGLFYCPRVPSLWTACGMCEHMRLRPTS